MTELILGLILFLGAHSVRIVADDWRTQKMEALGEKAFKGVHALISLLGRSSFANGGGVESAYSHSAH